LGCPLTDTNRQYDSSHKLALFCAYVSCRLYAYIYIQKELAEFSESCIMFNDASESAYHDDESVFKPHTRRSDIG